MDIINELKQNEGNAIIETFTMMTYILSIGRVLEKGGVDKFTKIILNEIKNLEKINSQDEFDNFHDSVVNLVVEEIKTKKREPQSYGQAQKALNVFLKVYVDWACRPNLKKSEQLRVLLHVPLDSILMREVKNKYPNEYEKHIVATYDSVRDSLRKTDFYKKFGESGLRILIKPSDFSLNKIIYKKMYYAWQYCLRAIYPEKPVLLDVLWSLKRKNN